MFRPCWSGWRTAIGLSHRPRDGNVVSSLHCMNDPQPEGHMASYIQRRKFLATVGGAAAWRRAARARRPAMPVIGFLRSSWRADAAHLGTAVRKGLEETGFVEGQNVAIECRSADDHLDRLPALVADLLRRQAA